MKCEEVIELMQRDVDGDLNPEEKKKLSYHLSSCYDCQALFDRLKNLSFQLEALPKVNPAYSIVDKVLPALEQIEHAPGENVTDLKQKSGFKDTEMKGKGFRKNKKWWIPSIAAAVLFGALVVMDQSSRIEMDLLSSSSQESAYDEASQSNDMGASDFADSEKTDQDNVENFSTSLAPETPSEASEGQAGTSEGTVPEARISQAPTEETTKEEAAKEELRKEGPTKDGFDENDDGEDNQEQMTFSDSPAEDEAPKYVSADGVYTAHEGLGGGDILIQKEDRAYYITKNTWEEPWEVESIEWISNHELYYVLYHPGQEERQYWIVNADERTEEQLEEPYHSEK